MSCERPGLFADTSVLANRHFASAQFRAAAEDALSSKPVTVCGYVIAELRATFLYVFARLHKLIVDSDGDVAEGLRRAHRYHNVRERDRLFHVTVDLIDNCPPDADDTEKLRWIQIMVEGGLMDELLRGTQRLRDPINCRRPQDVDTWEGTTYKATRRCRRSEPPQCDLVQFLEERGEQLQRLADGPDRLDEKVHKRFRAVAREVCSDADAARGSNCSFVLADAIIALQCPEDACVCTTNVDDFRVILSTLGSDPPVDARPTSGEGTQQQS